MESLAEIRLALARDLGAVANLAMSRAGGEHRAWVERLTKDLDNEERGLWVADQAGEVLGYGRAHYFQPPPDSLDRTAPEGFYLIGLGIWERHRRQGLGDALTRARLDWISQRASDAWYFTNARNVASLSLHEHLGFREVTRDFVYPGVEFEGGVGVLCKIDLRVRAPTTGRD